MDRSLDDAAKLMVAEIAQQANDPGFTSAGKGGKSFGKGEDGSMDRLFVSRVPQSVSKEDLRTHFSQFGELTDVYLPLPPGSTNHKGIAFVSFTDTTGLQKAMQQPGHIVNGEPIGVDLAAPRAPPPLTVTSACQTGCRLFLTKVTQDISRMDLQQYFTKFGELDDCYVPPGNKGIAFVSYKDPNHARNVLQNQQHEVKAGNVIIVAQAFDRPPPGSKGGFGGGKGFGGAPQVQVVHQVQGFQQNPGQGGYAGAAYGGCGGGVMQQQAYGGQPAYGGQAACGGQMYQPYGGQASASQFGGQAYSQPQGSCGQAFAGQQQGFGGQQAYGSQAGCGQAYGSQPCSGQAYGQQAYSQPCGGQAYGAQAAGGYQGYASPGYGAQAAGGQVQANPMGMGGFGGCQPGYGAPPQQGGGCQQGYQPY